MLFHAWEFMLGLWPLAIALVSLARLFDGRGDWCWGTGAAIALSLVFYGWWNPHHLSLLTGSIVLNYLIGWRLARHPSRFLLGVGIVANLGLLGAWKYGPWLARMLPRSWPQRWTQAWDWLQHWLQARDWLQSFAQMFPSGELLPTWLTGTMGDPLALPLGISFFTFQQIAYLVAIAQGTITLPGVGHYALFVCFFPQLIAGPIVRPGDFFEQVAQPWRSPPEDRQLSDRLAVSITLFVMGLTKKVLIADRLSPGVATVFAGSGAELPGPVVVLGVVGYGLQLYFDFSGYSDMAIAVAYSLGIRLPLNFNSPYKAISLRHFWRRWHISLSDFFRDFLYIPLGGNRHGFGRQLRNGVIVMGLAGVWHGAGWTFVVWGLWHGLGLVANGLGRSLGQRLGRDPDHPGVLGRAVGWGLTWSFVMVGWIWFRSPTFPAAVRLLLGLGQGWSQPWDRLAEAAITTLPVGEIGIATAIALLLPNGYQWLGAASPTLEPAPARDGIATLPGSGAIGRNWVWQPSPGGAVGWAVVTMLVLLSLHQPREFLYFQF